jgi:MFS family permease
MSGQHTDFSSQGQAVPSTRRQADWRQGWILVFAGFLPIMAIMALAPALPTLMAHFHDVPNARLMVPLLITVPSACIALFAPAAGAIADKYGRRQLLLWSMALYGAGGLIPFVVDHFWAVVSGRVLIGIGEAAVLTVVNTLLADYYEEKARHRWLMIQGVVGACLGTLTIAGSGFLAAQGWQYPFLVYGVAIPIFLASLLYLFEPAPRKQGQGPSAPAAAAATPFPYAIAFMVCGVTILLATIYYVQVINFSLLLKELGVVNPKSIGLSMAIPSIGVPIGAVLFKLTTRYGASTQILLVFLGYAIGLGGIGLAPDYKVALAFAFVQQLANGLIVPALIAWVQTKFSFEHRGRGMGWWCSSFFAAQFLSPAMVNLMRDSVGDLQGAFLAFGMIAAVCALLACVLRLRMPKPRPAASI